MITLEQMAEAHLVNVQREIANLQESKRKLEENIKQLVDYFDAGVKVLNERKTAVESSTQKDFSSVFGG